MFDTSLTGTRCRATKEIRSYQGLVRRYSEGIIQYNINNLGRDLISVQWDNMVRSITYIPLRSKFWAGERSLLSTLLIRWIASMKLRTWESLLRL
jgi:hypothetical protein